MYSIQMSKRIKRRRLFKLQYDESLFVYELMHLIHKMISLNDRYAVVCLTKLMCLTDFQMLCQKVFAM